MVAFAVGANNNVIVQILQQLEALESGRVSSAAFAYGALHGFSTLTFTP